MTNTDSLNKPDPMAEDNWLDEILVAVFSDSGQLIGTNEVVAIQIARKRLEAYVTNKIIERLEMIKATDSTRWVTNPSGMAGISFNVIDEAIAELRKTL